MLRRRIRTGAGKLNRTADRIVVNGTVPAPYVVSSLGEFAAFGMPDSYRAMGRGVHGDSTDRSASRNVDISAGGWSFLWPNQRD